MKYENVLKEINDDGEKTDGEKKKYFSFGLSILDDDKNAERINELRELIDDVKKKTGNVGVKNVVFIPRLLRFVKYVIDNDGNDDE